MIVKVILKWSVRHKGYVKVIEVYNIDDLILAFAQDPIQDSLENRAMKLAVFNNAFPDDNEYLKIRKMIYCNDREMWNLAKILLDERDKNINNG
jgi:hypothetical protein